MRSKKAIPLWLVGGVIALASAVSAIVCHSPVHHVAGTWNLNYLTNNCSVPGGGTLVLEQTGENLAGYYFVSGSPPCLINGTLKAPDIHFDVNVLVNTRTYEPLLWLSFDGKIKQNEDGSFTAEGEFSENGVKLNKEPNVLRQAWRAQYLWPIEESNSSLLNRWNEKFSRMRHGG